MKNNEKLESISPSGVSRMGETDVAFYKRGNRLWFDKKAIEKVLTGKNQHNLLGQYKDPKNHGIIFDLDRKEKVAVISKAGVSNYLQNAWSVKDENRHCYYSGVKAIENPQKETTAEPLQMPMFDEKNLPKLAVKIIENSDGTEVYSTFDDQNPEDLNKKIIKMLLSTAQELMSGSLKVMPIN